MWFKIIKRFWGCCEEINVCENVLGIVMRCVNFVSCRGDGGGGYSKRSSVMRRGGIY